jgi:dTDP-4-amino-4,6-dideoxygalactose transaminase
VAPEGSHRWFNLEHTSGFDRVFRHRLVVPDLPAPSEYLPLLEEIFENGWYSNFGPLVRRFEAELVATQGASEETCVTCTNATAGLAAALLASGRGGDVLLPAFTFAASLGAIRAAGKREIIIDVSQDDWALGGDLLDRALGATGAGVAMLVTPFGMRRDLGADLAICRKRGAVAVIDNAAGLGGPRPANRLGEGIFEIFSMHATKPFAVGEGGAIFAHRAHDAALRSALNFALDTYAEPGGPAWGFNGKMSEFHAAVGISQLRRIGNIVSRRQAFAALYQDRLTQYPAVVCPRDMSCSPWQFFPVLLPSAAAAERLVQGAAASSVEIRRYYSPSLSRWPDARCFEACPIAEDLSGRMCALPVRALDSSSEAEEITGIVLDALDRALIGR